MNQDDGGAHYSPLSKQGLRNTVGHHAHGHQELQESVGPVDNVDDFIHVLHRSFTNLLHHEEDVDQKGAKNLRGVESFLLYYTFNIHIYYLF